MWLAPRECYEGNEWSRRSRPGACRRSLALCDRTSHCHKTTWRPAGRAPSRKPTETQSLSWRTRAFTHFQDGTFFLFSFLSVQFIHGLGSETVVNGLKASFLAFLKQHSFALLQLMPSLPMCFTWTCCLPALNGKDLESRESNTKQGTESLRRKNIYIHYPILIPGSTRHLRLRARHHRHPGRRFRLLLFIRHSVCRTQLSHSLVCFEVR